jgi:hypothetical protein
MAFDRQVLGFNAKGSREVPMEDEWFAPRQQRGGHARQSRLVCPARALRPYRERCRERRLSVEVAVEALVVAMTPNAAELACHYDA